jgi:hypothetical protein
VGSGLVVPVAVTVTAAVTVAPLVSVTLIGTCADDPFFTELETATVSVVPLRDAVKPLTALVAMNFSAPMSG